MARQERLPLSPTPKIPAEPPGSTDKQELYSLFQSLPDWVTTIWMLSLSVHFYRFHFTYFVWEAFPLALFSAICKQLVSNESLVIRWFSPKLRWPDLQWPMKMFIPFLKMFGSLYKGKHSKINIWSRRQECATFSCTSEILEIEELTTLGNPANNQWSKFEIPKFSFFTFSKITVSS